MFKKNEVIKLKSKLFSSLSEKGCFGESGGFLPDFCPVNGKADGEIPS